jgi:hypothetical protein
MAALAGRVLSGIFSAAPSVFRSIWGVIKSAPALNAIKNTLLTTAVTSAAQLGSNMIKNGANAL